MTTYDSPSPCPSCPRCPAGEVYPLGLAPDGPTYLCRLCGEAFFAPDRPAASPAAPLSPVAAAIIGGLLGVAITAGAFMAAKPEPTPLPGSSRLSSPSPTHPTHPTHPASSVSAPLNDGRPSWNARP